MSLDRLELLEVRLGSGKVYLVPRALLVALVRACPDESLALIQEVGAEKKTITHPLLWAWDIHLRQKPAFPVRNEQEGC